MNIRALVKMLLPLCILLVFSQHSNGLDTRKCHEDRLKVEIKKYGSCLKTVTDEYAKGGGFYSENKKKGTTKLLHKIYSTKSGQEKGLRVACQHHNKLWTMVEKCNHELATKCFDIQMFQVVHAIQSYFKLQCTSQDITGMIDPKPFKIFPRLVKQFIGPYFKSLVRFDFVRFKKTCTIDQMADEFMQTMYPCIKEHVHPFYSQLKDYFDTKNMTLPRYVSSCETIKSAIDSCFDENACFSQNEMDLVRYLAATVYQWEMSISSQIADVISLSQLMYWLSNPQAEQPRFDDFMAKILKTVDFVINDFKNNELLERKNKELGCSLAFLVNK